MVPRLQTEQSRSRRSPRHSLGLPETSQTADLEYACDTSPGIRRIAWGGSFRYVLPNGGPVTDPSVLNRIKALAIPPAWQDVWICALGSGHMQATGRDARGRKQYRYHANWRRLRDESKYNRLIEFGQVLPKLRAVTEIHLKLPGLPRKKVLAAVVHLLQRTLIRVGNEEYAQENHSYGLTTLRDKHARVTGPNVEFQFRGKGGKTHRIGLTDRRLARIVKRCRDLPGYDLFQYVDSRGRPRDIRSEDVNAYIREITGRGFTAKDFRTWFGTVLATRALQSCGPCTSQAEGRRNVNRALEAVASLLGNTRSICRKCYVHPAAIEAYLTGILAKAWGKKRSAPPARITRDEHAMLKVIRRVS